MPSEFPNIYFGVVRPGVHPVFRKPAGVPANISCYTQNAIQVKIKKKQTVQRSYKIRICYLCWTAWQLHCWVHLVIRKFGIWLSWQCLSEAWTKSSIYICFIFCLKLCYTFIFHSLNFLGWDMYHRSHIPEWGGLN